jgi:hypothetical protein
MPIDISKVDSSGFKIVGAYGRHANESSFCGDRGGVFNTQKHEPNPCQSTQILQAQRRSIMLGKKFVANDDTVQWRKDDIARGRIIVETGV